MKKMRMILILGLLSISLTDSIAQGNRQASQLATVDYYHINPSTFFSLAEVSGELTEDGLDIQLLDAAIFHATNMARSEHGLTPLKYLVSLHQMASFHSKEMANHQFTSHVNTVNPAFSTMELRSDFFKANAYSENVASYFMLNYRQGERYTVNAYEGATYYVRTNGEPIRPHNYHSFAKALIDAWLNSPGHRENILDPTIKFAGCGIAIPPVFLRKGMPVIYATQNFSEKSGAKKFMVLQANITESFR